MTVRFNKDYFSGMPDREEARVPNGWGKQRYGGCYRKVKYDRQIDFNNKKKKRSFIRDFVINNISGNFLNHQKKRQPFYG
ncbi:hypothetical protein FUAX_19740 [Fulvitalea axinellae]|uniref:Uncharacterized protein n=1 Tax=Fulvitalea axinellae TaxID=1182444 RepID=A0AAU9CRE1_9BACT|nr:hypothetical protein FUAX_19740 [Fulvitalea axinellae]